MIRRSLMAALGLALLGSLTVAPAGAQTVNVTYSWSAPTTGSPAVSYEVERSIGGGAWTLYTTTTTTSAVVAAPALVTIQVRVRAVDALGRKGTYSDPSDIWTNDPGIPGACGKPVRTP